MAEVSLVLVFIAVHAHSKCCLEVTLETELIKRFNLRAVHLDKESILVSSPLPDHRAEVFVDLVLVQLGDFLQAYETEVLVHLDDHLGLASLVKGCVREHQAAALE